MVNWTAAAPLAGCVPLQVRRTLSIVASDLAVREFGSISGYFAALLAQGVGARLTVDCLRGPSLRLD